MSNQRTLVLFIATSLDGFIARENVSLDWLFKLATDSKGLERVSLSLYCPC